MRRSSVWKLIARWTGVFLVGAYLISENVELATYTDENGAGRLLVFLLFWMSLLGLAAVGLEARLEVGRAIERPLDERERQVRLRSMAISYVCVIALAGGSIHSGLLGEKLEAWPALVVAAATLLAAIAAATSTEGLLNGLRMLIRPGDERERQLRGSAVAVSYAILILFCFGWLIFAEAADHPNIAPLLLLMIALGSLILAACFQIGRGRSKLPATTGSPSELTAELERRPAWLVIFGALSLGGALASTVVLALRFAADGLFLDPDSSDGPGFLQTPYPTETIWGIVADGAILLVAALVWSAVVAITVSFWTGRRVSVWPLVAIAVAFGVVGFASQLAPIGWLLVLPVQLGAVRYLAIRSGLARGFWDRINLSRSRVALAVFGLLALFFVPFSYGEAHPLVAEKASAINVGGPNGMTVSWEDRAQKITLGPKRAVYYKPTLRNLGVSSTKLTAVEGVRASIPDVATLQSVRMPISGESFGTSAPVRPGTQAPVTLASRSKNNKLILRLGFNCAVVGTRTVEVDAMRLRYEKFGRVFSETVPFQNDLFVKCPRRVRLSP